MGCLKIAIAVIVPPIGVLLVDGLGVHFLINLVLTAAFYLPGLIHALWRLSMNGAMSS